MSAHEGFGEVLPALHSRTDVFINNCRWEIGSGTHPSLLSDNAKRALNFVDNKPSNLISNHCKHLWGRKSLILGINLNPLTAWRPAYDYP